MGKIKIESPSTVYIAFKGQNPNTFKLFSETYGLYYFRELDGRCPRIKFNLPHVGNYESKTDFSIVKIVPIEIPDNLPALPPYERTVINDVKEIKIVNDLNLNGTPAKVYTKQGVIVRGKRFFLFPKPIRLFLTLHEIGHFFYGVTDADIDKANKMEQEKEGSGKSWLRWKGNDSEMKCDLYAFVKFMEMGFNRSTAFYALSRVLRRSQANTDRLKSISKHIQSTQQKSIYE